MAPFRWPLLRSAEFRSNGNPFGLGEGSARKIGSQKGPKVPRSGVPVVFGASGVTITEESPPHRKDASLILLRNPCLEDPILIPTPGFLSVAMPADSRREKLFDFVREFASKYFRIVPVRDSTQQNKA